MPEVLAVGLSLSDQAQTVGAIAGFAAILGLAVMSLLYFAQAREVKRLRDWAGSHPERASDVAQQVTAEAQRRVVAQPVAAKPAAAATAAGQAAATAATPGNGQPSTAAPASAPVPGTSAPVPGRPVPVPGTPAGAPKPGVAPPATAAGASAQPPVPPPDSTAIPPATAPSGRDAPVAPAPAVPAPVRPAVAARAGTGATRTLPAGTPPTGRSPRQAPRSAPGSGSGGRFSRTMAIVAGSVVLVLVIGIVLATQLGGGADKKAAVPNTVGTPGLVTTPADGDSTPTTSTTAAPDKANTTVAVLNGTTVTGLANSVADKITGAGYKKGAVTNAADQQRSATQVSYAPGSQAEGEAVAKLIGVGADAVGPLDETTAAIAGTNATVVVTVGSDQNRQ